VGGQVPPLIIVPAPQASLDAHLLFIECGHTLKDVPGTLRRNWAVNTFVAIAGSRFHAGSINT
jgi:hypothetical protein